MGMGAPSPPPPPDYVGAAQQQGAANIEAARVQAGFNNPNINTPYGSQTVTPIYKKGKVERYQINQTLSPEEQQLYDLTENIKIGLAGTAQDQLGRVSQGFSQPFDWGSMPKATGLPNIRDTSGPLPAVHTPGSNLPTVRTSMPYMPTPRDTTTPMPGIERVPGADAAARQQTIDALYNQQSSILDPRYKSEGDRMRSDLANQGITQGSEAYTRALDDFNRQKGQDYQQAMNSSIVGGGAEQSRLFDIGARANEQLYGQQANNFGLGQRENQQYFEQEAARMGLSQQEYQNVFGQESNLYGIQQQRDQQQFGQEADRMGLGLQREQQLFGQEAQLYGLSQQARQQAIQEQEMERNRSLNELNALRMGNQVTAPQFQQWSGGGNIQAPDYFGAAQQRGQADLGIWNQQAASDASNTQGLYSLGGTAMGLGATAAIVF